MRVPVRLFASAELIQAIGGDASLGVLYLQGGHDDGPFTQDDLEKAEVFTKHIGPFADRLLVKRQQEDIADPTREVRERIQADLIELIPHDWQAAHDLVETLPGVLELQTYGEALHILVDSGKERLPQIESALNKNEITYQSARVAPTRMEEAFISLIRKMDERND